MKFEGRRIIQKKNKAKKVIAGLSLTILLVILIFLCAKFLLKYFSQKAVCEVCKNTLTGSVCEVCDENKNIKHCKQCENEVKDGILCSECLDKTDKDYYDSSYWCEGCIRDLSRKEISLVNHYGYVYCENCDTENYCSECHSPLHNDDDDAVCSGCAKYFCAVCDEVLEESEVEYEKEGEYFCEKCAVSTSCIKCGRELEKGDDDDICFLCADYVCIDCSEVLAKNEGYTDKFTDTYCRDCKNYYSDNTCIDCGDPIGEEDDDNVCWICADYYCCKCYEVITKEEIVKKDDKGAYCKDCN